jgi:hypothetical protein
MKLGLRNIFTKFVVFALALLLTDACPDVSLNLSQPTKKGFSAIEQVVDQVYSDILKLKHNDSDTNENNDDVDTSLELDYYVVENQDSNSIYSKTIEIPSPLHLYCWNNVVIDIIPFPPSYLV